MERNQLFNELERVAFLHTGNGNGRMYESAVGTAVRFPSGESLTVVDVKSGKEEEHWDVTGSGHPLLDTSGANQQKMLSRHFSVKEFARNGQTVARIDPKLVAVLQQIRDAIGKPLNITSGYRSYLYNKRLYEKRNQAPTKSKHIAGSAVDFNVAGMNGLELAKKVVDVLGRGNYGIGLGKNFIHLDILRNKFETWPYSDIDSGWTSELSRYYKNSGTPQIAPPVPATAGGTSIGVGLVGNIANVSSAVISLIVDGITDPNAITNFVFQLRHPELKGRKLQASDPQSLKKEWVQVRDQVVLPLLEKFRSGSLHSGNGSSVSKPTVPADKKIPDGYVSRTWKNKFETFEGLKKTAPQRVDSVYYQLIQSGKIDASELTDRDIDIFQRIANVETGGNIQSLNAYDFAIVSIGFQQLTFIHNKIQRWIALAPDAFRRFGIELNPAKEDAYKVSRKTKGGNKIYTVTALKGVKDPESLRWNGFARAFYEAGLDHDIIIAEARLGKMYCKEHLSGLKNFLKRNGAADLMELFEQQYNNSAHLRGLFQESYNHNPSITKKTTLAALKATSFLSAGMFLEHYKKMTRKHFGDEKGERLISKTSKGAIKP